MKKIITRLEVKDTEVFILRNNIICSIVNRDEVKNILNLLNSMDKENEFKSL